MVLFSFPLNVKDRIYFFSTGTFFFSFFFIFALKDTVLELTVVSYSPNVLRQVTLLCFILLVSSV